MSDSSLRHINIKRMNVKRILPWVVFLLLLMSVPGDAVESREEPLGLTRRIRVPILMYHYISVPPNDADKYRVDLSVTPENFRRQLEWLRQHNYTAITPDDLAAAALRGKKLPARPVLITFDDGYLDAYTEAFPLLRQYNFRGTFFVVTEWLDEGRAGYLTWQQAKEMSLWGMSIQSHSRRHYDMRNRDSNWLVYEILGSVESIAANVGVRPRYFCFPAGRYDQNVLSELKAAGIVAAFTTSDGLYITSDDMLRLPRIRIRGSTTLSIFAELLTREG
jgi:peptidoglycan/xylan/chitin deacetylase (PgdA/CDA1 family)